MRVLIENHHSHENKTPIVTLVDDGLNCRNAKVISPYLLHHQFSMLRLP